MNNIWNDFDTSKDGYLSLEESHDFIKESFGKTQSKPFTEADIVEVFNRIDTDGDGRINKGEMAEFLVALTKSGN